MEAYEPPLEEDFRLGEWLVHPSLNRISDASGEFVVEPRAMSVLVALKHQAGQVVTRQQLHERVWGNVAVSEETVNRAIFDLRRLLQDEALDPRYIETIRKVGYRLVASVSPAERPSAGPAAPGTVSVVRRRSVAPGWWVGAAVVFVILALGFLSTRPGSTGNPPPSPRVRQLTAYAGYETHPTVSADGGKLAFAWDGGKTGNVDIYWRPIDEDAPVRLTSHPDREDNPEWAPDGRSISFIRSGPGTCALMLAHIDDRQVTKLAECREAGVSRPVWSTDGQTLFFSDRDSADEPFRIQRLDVKSRRLSLVVSPVFGTLGDLYPAVSPSGQQLAFVRAVSKSTISTYLTPAIGDIFRLDFEGVAARSLEPKRLTYDNEVIAGLTWSPSGDRIVFASSRVGLGYSLWQVPAGHGGPSLLVSTTGLLRYPVRAGRDRFAYERWEGKTDIWSVPLGGDQDAPLRGRAVQVSTRSDLNPRLSPDGTRLAFTSERTGNYEIWVSRFDGDQAVQLTFFENAPAESPMWSPDGGGLVFEVRGRDGSDVYRIDGAGGDPRQLTSGDFDNRSPAWSLDGRFIYFASNRSGSWQIWRMRADGQKPARVTPSGGFRAIESAHTTPPGLYFSKRDRGGIWELDAQGSERLLAPLAPEHWGNWTIVNGRLFFVELAGNATLIKTHDLRDGTTAVVGKVKGWISRETPNLTVSADESTAILARFTGLAADLLVVEPIPLHREP